MKENKILILLTNDSVVQGSKLTLANLQNASEKNIHLANVYELESSMSPKHLERFASDLTSLLVEKILLAILCKWPKQVNFEPCNTLVTDKFCQSFLF